MLNIVVIGSGVMGAGIAGHIANCGHKVHLLDIVLNNSQDRNILANKAIEKLSQSLEDRVINIHPGNLEDNLDVIKQADWIIEVIVENLQLKQSLYKKLEAVCKTNAIISSNTSTIPLLSLINGMSERFKEHFLITHFFNPPRYMQLLELVTSTSTKQAVIDKIYNFLDINLGKIIIKSNDTPGFIANRIGCYWLECGLKTAIEMNMAITEVDGLISKSFGIPSTGIFGLFDLIGIDVMELIAKSLQLNLAQKDDFLKVYNQWPLINKMISEGFVGRKGKGGFYRITKDKDGNKIKEVMNFQSGEYEIFDNFIIPSSNIKELLTQNKYLKIVMGKTLSYAASLVFEVSNNLSDIDKAMRLGYNWNFGPFELIDIIGNSFFTKILEELKIQTPSILAKIGDNKFYQGGSYFTGEKYQKIPRSKGVIHLKDFDKIIFQNNSAIVRDIDNEIAAIEITSKMGILDQEFFNLVLEFFSNYASNFKAVVITNAQGNFSVGGDLKFMLACAKSKNFQAVEEYLELGQKAMLEIKYSTIPVISALKGMALGGGCELLLHSSDVVSHIEANVGLVEAGVGIIPAWGGCKELILRSEKKEQRLEAFKNILCGKKSNSPHKLGYKIVPNIERVLQEAKDLCIKKSQNYQAKIKQEAIKIDVNWNQEIKKLNLQGYNEVIAENIISVFSLNILTEENILLKEREVFINLLQNEFTIERMDYMLKTGKKLLN